jgi:hypothetical protein
MLNSTNGTPVFHYFIGLLVYEFLYYYVSNDALNRTLGKRLLT